jgi:peptide chain release factor 1
MFKHPQEAVVRLAALDLELMDPSIGSNPNRLRDLGQERTHLSPIVDLWTQLQKSRLELVDTEELMEDPEFRELASEEHAELSKRVKKLESDLKVALIPPDPFEGRDIILEVRAGTGGDEAALFACDLFRMYARFADQRRWKLEMLSSSEITVGGAAGKSTTGFKEVICQISGADAYRFMRHESGVHRVQRVPVTEAQGRIHTSAATVAIMPVAETIEVNIQESEIRVDVFRASGPGGQSVNTTDSAVRITHIPSGLVVQCQDEKSQHKNRAKALKVLSARLLEKQEQEQHDEAAEQRRSQVGTGDRSERIRTYNFPQNRLTDHRIGLTLYQLDRIMEGDLGPVVDGMLAALTDQMDSKLAGIPSDEAGG